MARAMKQTFIYGTGDNVPLSHCADMAALTTTKALVIRAAIYFGITILVVSVSCSYDKSKYCKICADHTLCIHEEISNNSCSTGLLTRGVNYKQIDLILALHNALRGKVARGHEVVGPQPRAANMKYMRWDPELMEIAQRWADQCTFGHDTCRNVERFEVGQNVYIKHSKRRTGPPDWEHAIMEWYGEVVNFDISNVLYFKNIGKAGHYTQLVAAETSLVGCGHTEWTSNGKVSSIYICNYGPSGNIPLKALYLIGKPCSACLPGAKCVNDLCLEP